MRAGACAIAIVCIGCKGSGSPAKPAPLDAAAVVVAAPPIDAQPPDAAAPAWGAEVDPASLTAWAPDVADATVLIHAVDVSAGWLRGALLRQISYVDRAETGLVSGRILAADAASAAKAAAAAEPRLAWTARKLGKKGVLITLQFNGAALDNLVRFSANVLERNIVLAAPTIDLDVSFRGVSAEAALEAYAEVAGLRIEHVENVWLVGAKDAPKLHLAKHAGHAKFSLDTKDATAGEVYALLGGLGADIGYAPCEGGAPVQLRLEDVSAEVAVAVIERISGVAPTDDEGCFLGAWTRGADDELVAIGSRGPVRLGVARGGGKSMKVERGGDVVELGETSVILSTGTAVMMFPPSDAPEGRQSLPARAAELRHDLEISRLAATVLSANHRLAIFERPDGTWWWMNDQRMHDSEVPIEVTPGVVTIHDAPTPWVIKLRARATSSP